MHRSHAFGLGFGSCLISFLNCNQFISGTDKGTRGGVLLVWVGVVGLFVSCVPINLSQTLIITCVTIFSDCSCFILDLFIVFWDIAQAVFLQLQACNEPPCAGVKGQKISQVS
jgi:hypothetical protein